MKYLILLLSLNAYSQRCNNFISLEGAQVSIARAQQGIVSELPNNWQRGRLCFDGIDWRAAKIVKRIEEIPLTERKLERKCKDRAECREFAGDNPRYCEDERKDLGRSEEFPTQWRLVVDQDKQLVYCIRQIGVEQRKTDEDILVNDPDLLQAARDEELAREQKLEQQRLEREQKREELKAFSQRNPNSIPQIRAEIDRIIKVLGIEQDE